MKQKPQYSEGLEQRILQNTSETLQQMSSLYDAAPAHLARSIVDLALARFPLASERLKLELNKLAI